MHEVSQEAASMPECCFVVHKLVYERRRVIVGMYKH